MEVVFRGVHEFDAAVSGMVARARAAAAEATKKTAAALIRQAKVNASGPPRTDRVRGTGGKVRRLPVLEGPLQPGQRRIELGRVTRFGTVLQHRDGGPGVVTGRLRNSIVVVSQGPTGAFGYQVTVAPTVVYSRRLELGFNGTDSRGRRYNQPPYPFLGPAYHFIVPLVATRFYEEAWAAALRK